MKIIVLFLGFLSLCITADAQQALKTIPLYDGPIPNAKDVPDEEKTDDRNGRPIVSKITRPTLSIFLPERTSSPTWMGCSARDDERNAPAIDSDRTLYLPSLIEEMEYMTTKNANSSVMKSA